jgi:hypothetical protein
MIAVIVVVFVIIIFVIVIIVVVVIVVIFLDARRGAWKSASDIGLHTQLGHRDKMVQSVRIDTARAQSNK